MKTFFKYLFAITLLFSLPYLQAMDFLAPKHSELEKITLLQLSFGMNHYEPPPSDREISRQGIINDEVRDIHRKVAPEVEKLTQNLHPDIRWNFQKILYWLPIKNVLMNCFMVFLWSLFFA